MQAKEALRQEWDETVLRANDSVDTWYRATRLLPFFYDSRYDEERAVRLLRWLVQSQEIVDGWMQGDRSYPYAMIRLVATLLKSVGSINNQTEYTSWTNGFWD